MTDQATQLRAMCAAKDDRAADEDAQWSVADPSSYARGHADDGYPWDAPRITERLGLAPRDGAQGTLPVELAEHNAR